MKKNSKKPLTPGAKLINRGGASTTPNRAAKKLRGGTNSKGTKKR